MLVTDRLSLRPHKIKFGTIDALDARKTPDDYRENIDPTAWLIHCAMHRNNSQARCIIHLHSKYATALSVLKAPSSPTVDQTTCRFHNHVAIDTGIDGMGLDDEVESLSQCLGNKRIMMMGNHRFISIVETPALAFDLAYDYELGCRTYITALSTRAPWSFLPDSVAEKTALQWEQYENAADKHLAAVRSV